MPATSESQNLVSAEALIPMRKLNRDVLKALSGRAMAPDEARFLVDTYYTFQRYRIRSENQMRSLVGNSEPHEVVQWFGSQFDLLEGEMKKALQGFAQSDPVGRWAMSIYGVGPVIAAGLLAHIKTEVWYCMAAAADPSVKACGQRDETHDGPHEFCALRRVQTAGAVWKFAGLDPTSVWKKGEKRPWNASLKVLATYKLGESFVKVNKREGDFYGKLYLIRKAYEQERNEAGRYAELAKSLLKSRKIGEDTVARKCYEEGKLPPGHIHQRARRWAVKIFLSHYHHVAYRYAFGERPPKPFAIAVLGHAHEIEIPNYPWSD